MIVRILGEGQFDVAVRRHGAPVPADALVASELVLPARDASLEAVRSLLAGEGLIPG